MENFSAPSTATLTDAPEQNREKLVNEVVELSKNLSETKMNENPAVKMEALNKSRKIWNLMKITGFLAAGGAVAVNALTNGQGQEVMQDIPAIVTTVGLVQGFVAWIAASMKKEDIAKIEKRSAELN